jgi:RNA polymerase sigma-70 factor (ECF subfamily)
MAAFLDPDLAQRATAGDTAALQQVWHGSRRWLAGVLLAHAGQGSEVEDLLQEVALKFVREVHRLQEPAALAGWLRAVAVNTARDHVRRRRREGTSSEAVDVVDPASEPRPAWTPADRARELVERMPLEYREALLLHGVHGLTLREIAAAMQMPIATVGTRLCRARAMLREALASEVEPESSGCGAHRT